MATRLKEYYDNTVFNGLKDKFEFWLEHHVAPFDGFDDFLAKSKMKSHV